jgi:cyclophilin family peptidyl-prolyl cis-trans isomerase
MSDQGNTLTLETTQGPVVIRMRPDLAPNHVAHIKRLVSEGFYDGIVFHRVIEGFMAQTGCPHGTGTGGSKYPNLKQEFNAAPMFDGCWRDTGFATVPADEPLAVGDLLLMSLERPLNHIAVYVGDGQILHHVRGRLSSRDVCGGYYQKNTGRVIRHSSRMG